jgi:hypothetical protein
MLLMCNLFFYNDPKIKALQNQTKNRTKINTQFHLELIIFPKSKRLRFRIKPLKKTHWEDLRLQYKLESCHKVYTSRVLYQYDLKTQQNKQRKQVQAFRSEKSLNLFSL